MGEAMKLLDIPTAQKSLTISELKVAKCVHDFRMQKVEPKYISILTHTPIEEVEKAILVLGKRDLLPSCWSTN